MVTREKVYACLDPRGHTLATPKIPLTAPRLANLGGKNVLVYMFEMDPNLMPEVRKQLLNRVLGVSMVWWNGHEDGDLRVKEIPKEPRPDVAIVGVGF